MPITIERVINEPIIITYYIGKVTAEEFRDMYEKTGKIIEEIGMHTYRIANTTGVESSFGEVMKMASLAAQHIPYATGDERVTSLLVGTEAWGKLFTDLVRQPQYGGILVPFFRTLEDAFEYIRIQRLEKGD